MKIPFLEPFPNALTVYLSLNGLGVVGRVWYDLHVRNIILDKGEITLYKEFLFMIFRQLTALLDHGSFLTVEN